MLTSARIVADLVGEDGGEQSAPPAAVGGRAVRAGRRRAWPCLATAGWPGPPGGAARGRRRRAVPTAPSPSWSRPRDEATRIGPLLAPLSGRPASTRWSWSTTSRRTRRRARRRRRRPGRRSARPSPPAGPARRGRCSRGSARPPRVGRLPRRRHRPGPAGCPAALVGARDADGLDLLTVGGRFECPTPALRWLHPALLTTLVYRFGPPGPSTRRGPRAASATASAWWCAARCWSPPVASAPSPPPHRGRRPGARCRRPGWRVGAPRRRRPADGADVRDGARRVARVGPLAPAARRRPRPAGGWSPRRCSRPGPAAAAPPRRPRRRARRRPAGCARRHARRHAPGLRPRRPAVLAVADGRSRGRRRVVWVRSVPAGPGGAGPRRRAGRRPMAASRTAARRST